METKVSQRVAFLQISAPLLQKVLGLPEGTEFHAALINRQKLGAIELLIEHESLPEVAIGDEIPKVKANFNPFGFMKFD